MQALGLILLGGATFFVTYTYALYPVLLWIWARMKTRPVHRSEVLSRISVILAMHNEEQVIAPKCQSLLAQDYPEDLLEIIVVSDGSTDRSAERVRELGNPRIRLVEYTPRRGKAAALNAGVAEAGGEILVFTDARQPLGADAVRRLAENFANPEVGATSGEMRLSKETSQFGNAMSRYWSYEKWVRHRESEIDSVCGVTGCLWAMRRDLYTTMLEGIVLDDVFLPMHVVRRGYRVVCDSRAIAYDRPTEASEIEYQRKRRTLLGNYQLLQACPWLLTRQNRIRFQFVSHKVCRLLVPVALLVFLVSSFVLDRLVFRSLFFIQLGFYALGIFDRLIPAGTSLRKFSSLANFFLIVHLGAVSGFLLWLAGSRDIWVKAQNCDLQGNHRI